MRWAAVMVVAWLSGAGAGPHQEEAAAAHRARMFAGGGAKYRLESTALLAAAAATGVPPGDAALRLRALFTVATRWAQPPHVLLDLAVAEVSVWGVGAGRADWAERALPAALRLSPSRSLHAVLHLRGSRAHQLFLPEGPPAARNLLRSLASLLQFDTAPLERNETDASGDCAALYEPTASGVRKVKSRCSWNGGQDGAGVTSRRLVRYDILDTDNAPSLVYAEEVHEVGLGGARLKARAWARLQLEGGGGGGAAGGGGVEGGGTLEGAVGALPGALLPAHMALQPDGEPLTHMQEEEAKEAISAGAVGAGAGAAGRGGSAGDAAALLRAVTAARAHPALLRRVMATAHHQQFLEELAMVCGAAGLGEGGALLGEAPPAAIYTYLAAIALAPHTQESAVAAVAHLADKTSEPALREAAALSAAAAAAGGGGALSAALSARHLAALSACRHSDEPCAVTALLALANLRHGPAANAALQAAQRGSEAVAMAALTALESIAPDGSAAWAGVAAGVRRLAVGAAAVRRPLAVRAAALRLWLQRAAAAGTRLGAAPLALRTAAAALRDGPPELRRVLWAHLRLLQGEGGPAADLIRSLPPSLRNWDTLSAPGISAAVWADTGLGAALGAAAHGLGGALRHAAVTVTALHREEDDDLEDSIRLNIWTRGLQDVAGGTRDGDGGGDGDGEETAAGLRLAVRGVHMPATTLFSSQGELLGLVWAGAGSEPTSVARVGRVARGQAAIPLAVGAQWAHVRWGRATVAALDAHAAVSLWSRTARAAAELRAATFGRTEAAAAAWGHLSAAVEAEAEGALSVPADMDFYAEPALCVRAAVTNATRSVRASLRAAAGRWAVRRERALQQPAWARSLALPGPLAAHCARLAA